MQLAQAFVPAIWLASVIDPDPLLAGIAHTKLRQFAAEAAAPEVNDLLDITQPGKRPMIVAIIDMAASMD